MSVLVDTSAFLAILNKEDADHQAADGIWGELLRSGEAVVCTNYVLVETFALVQHRRGLEAVHARRLPRPQHRMG